MNVQLFWHVGHPYEDCRLVRILSRRGKPGVVQVIPVGYENKMLIRLKKGAGAFSVLENDLYPANPGPVEGWYYE